jgi:hypothetical protein
MHYSIPGLDTRETAIVVWVSSLLAFTLTKADVRSSFAATLKTLFGSWLLVGVMAATLGYAVAATWFLAHEYYWDGSMLKTTVIWFFGFAIITVFSTTRKDGAYFWQLVRRNLTLAVLIQFIGSLHTFPLPIELVLVPVLFLIVGCLALASSDSQYAQIKKPLETLLSLIGIVVLLFSAKYLVTHFSEIVTRERIREFFLPLLLTALFVPFFYIVALFGSYQTMFVMVRFGLKENEDLNRFARWEIVRACGINLPRAQLFEERFRGQLWGVETASDVREVVRRFHAERNQSPTAMNSDA